MAEQRLEESRQRRSRHSSQHHQARSTLKRIDITKASGLEEMPGHTLKTCADQLTGVFLYIQPLLTACCSPHLPQSHHHHPIAQKVKNHYCPVALTPVIMKCFERIVLSYIKDIITASPGWTPVHLPSKPVYRGCHLHRTSSCPVPPGAPKHI